MSYEKQNFEDGQVLEAEHLNHMEDELARPKNWKEIEGKPVVTEGGDTLTWDGNTEGLVSFDFGGIMEPIYKVSNVIPSANDFVNGITMASDGEAITVDEAIMGEDSGILLGIDYLFMVVPAGVEGVEEGFYMNPAISSLTIPNYTGFAKEKIDPSYLPEHLHKWADIADKPIVVVNLDWDTFAIDKTPAEILALSGEGNIVLFGMSGTPVAAAEDDTGEVTASTTFFQIMGNQLMATTMQFDKDGNFANQKVVVFDGTIQ